jgi:hypothetical protein
MRYRDVYDLLCLAHQEPNEYVRDGLVRALSRALQIGDIEDAPPELMEHLTDFIEDLAFFEPALAGRDGFYGEEGLGYVLMAWLGRLPNPT